MPVLQVEKAFPELAMATHSAEEAGQQASNAMDGLLDQLSDGAATSSAAVDVQESVLPLGGGVVTDLPEGNWSWGSEGGVMLAVLKDQNGVPQALMYSSAADESWLNMRFNPSKALSSFLYEVDPSLRTSLDHAAFGLEAAAVGIVPGYQVGMVTEFVESAKSRTQGRGFGYASTDFLGWRWQGTNVHGMDIHLARSTGSWQSPKKLGGWSDENAALLEEHMPDMEDMTAVLESGEEKAESLRDLPSRPAYMVMGYAGVEGEVYSYFAFLCAAAPICAQAEAGAAMIRGIRPGESGGSQADGYTPMSTLSEESGLLLLDEAEVVDGATVTQMLTAATATLVAKLEEAKGVETAESDEEAEEAEAAGAAEEVEMSASPTSDTG